MTVHGIVTMPRASAMPEASTLARVRRLPSMRLGAPQRPMVGFRGAAAGRVGTSVVQEWICEPKPRSRRIDSRMARVLLVVNTSVAASTPVYFAMTGAAAASVTASR